MISGFLTLPSIGAACPYCGRYDVGVSIGVKDGAAQFSIMCACKWAVCLPAIPTTQLDDLDDNDMAPVWNGQQLDLPRIQRRARRWAETVTEEFARVFGAPVGDIGGDSHAG